MSTVTCEEQATPPDGPKRSRPPGCAAFSPLGRCSSLTDHSGYALSSRLGETKNRQQRGMVTYFKGLLRACQRFVFFAAMLRLDSDMNEFVVFAEQLAIGIRALWLVRHDRDHRRKFSDAHLPNMQVGHE